MLFMPLLVFFRNGFSVSAYLLLHSLQQSCHPLLYVGTGMQLVVEPDKCHIKACCRHGGNGIAECMLMLSVSFAHLSFHSVALHGSLEMLLGHADEHSYSCVPLLFSLIYGIDYPERKGYHRTASRFLEQIFHGIAPVEPLFLAEGIFSFLCHYIGGVVLLRHLVLLVYQEAAQSTCHGRVFG